MIFSSARLKLTLSYLAIIMVLSVLFSMALYQVSASQIERGLQRGGVVFDKYANSGIAGPRSMMIDLGREQLDQARRQLVANLLLLNLATLVVGGALSYWLARRTLEPIEEAMEAQSRFTADASHELRTPLTAMKSEIEVALRQSKLSSAEAKMLLASNLEEVAKLEALSNGLLRLSQYQTAIDPAALKLCDVHELVAEAVTRVTKAAKAQSITIEPEVSKGVSLQGDRESLVELLVILLDNAIKYSPPKTVVKITAAVHGSQVVLRVQDQGIGIKASDQPYIFNRFYRADQSRSKHEANGYGLGLSIAQRIVNLHDGTITVESAIGSGTTFILKMPRLHN